MVKVSVIVPVYNPGGYLEDCLKSLSEQTLRDIEFILIDDNSTDDSRHLIAEYAEMDSRFKLLCNSVNLGVTKARNRGLEIARGSYVYFLDSDDWIGSDVIENLYNLAIEYRADIIISGITLVWKGRQKRRLNKVREGLYRKNEIEDLLTCMYNSNLHEMAINWQMGGKLIERAKCVRYQLEVDDRITVGEDIALFVAILMNADRVYVDNQTASYYYRQVETSTMHSRQPRAYSYYYLWEYLKKIIGQNEMVKQQLQYIFCAGMQDDYTKILNLKKQNFYLFPYEKIDSHSAIVIYGAGIVGKSYYRQLKGNRYCEIKLLVDKNYKDNKDVDYPVTSPENIGKEAYDFIVIAAIDKGITDEIYEELIRNYPVDADKIIRHYPKTVADFVDYN